MKRKYEHECAGDAGHPAKLLVHNQGGLFVNTSCTPGISPAELSPRIGLQITASTPLHGPTIVAQEDESLNTDEGIYFDEHVFSSPANDFTMNRPTFQKPMHGGTGYVASREVPPTVSPSKEAQLRKLIDGFVDIYERLAPDSGDDEKPNYSYTELAYLAMLRSPNFCLPITEIYKYISSRFTFYKNSTRKHWKNAVRHSLAKTMCFNKIHVGRRASTSMKLSRSVYLWCVVPSSLPCFARGDYRPSNGKFSAEQTGYYRRASMFWADVGDYVACKMTSFRHLVNQCHNPGLVFEAQVCHITQSNTPTSSGAGPKANRTPFQERSLNVGTGDLFIELCSSDDDESLLRNHVESHGKRTGTMLNNRSHYSENLYASASYQKPEAVQHHQRISNGENVFAVKSGYGYKSMRLESERTGMEELNRMTPVQSKYTTEMTSPAYSYNNVGTDMQQYPRRNTPGQFIVPRPPNSKSVDPFMPKFGIDSPDVSISSMESERRTPPFSAYDSGFDTCDSSPEEAPSCRFQNTHKLGLDIGHFESPGREVLGEGCELSELDLDLSPFDFAELPDLSSSYCGRSSPSLSNTNDCLFKSNTGEFLTSTPHIQKTFLLEQRPITPMTSSPMPSRLNILPEMGNALPARPLPAYTPAPTPQRQINLPDIMQTPVYRSHQPTIPSHRLQQTTVPENAAVLIVYPSGLVSSTALPQSFGSWVYR